MKIKAVRIKNFRSFEDVEIPFDNYTSLIGPNGTGKSTILCALNIFFRELDGAATNLSELDAEDFHAGNTEDPIEITITFDDLDAEAQAEFSGYYRNGVLVVSAIAQFDKSTARATVKQYGQRSAMEAFKDFFKLYNDGAKATDLTAAYNNIREKYSELPGPTTKDGNRDALRSFEEAHPELCTLIPSEDQFYGFSKGINRLARFVQWVYVPAVKDVTKENIEAKNTALGKLLARTVRSKVNFQGDITALRDEALDRYRKIIEAQQSALNDISAALSARLVEWAHPEATARLSWAEDPRNSVKIEEPTARLIAGEGAFEGELARFGHGLQRSYLLALLQELAAGDDSPAPRLILGCEEPELYQHPPQARHLSLVLQKLSGDNAQIIVSTHSPYFVSGRTFESVRLLRRNGAEKRSDVSLIKPDDVAARLAEVTGEKPVPTKAEIARLHQALQPGLNEMFFAPRVILVEGLEDLAYVTSWMILTERWEEYRRGGCHLVPVNGKSNLIEPLIVAQKLQIPCFAVFDSDGNKTNAGERARHESDNKALLRLLGGDDAQPFPTVSVWDQSFVQWPANLGDTLKSEISAGTWDPTYGKATKGLGNPEGSFAKNTVHIGDHLALLRADGVAIPSLDKLCDAIITFGAT